jgi:hypothetical protein
VGAPEGGALATEHSQTGHPCAKDDVSDLALKSSLSLLPVQAEFTAQIDATLGSGAGAAGQAAAAAGSRTQPGSPGSCADRHSSTGSCDAGKADQRRDEL